MLLFYCYNDDGAVITSENIGLFTSCENARISEDQPVSLHVDRIQTRNSLHYSFTSMNCHKCFCCWHITADVTCAWWLRHSIC